MKPLQIAGPVDSLARQWVLFLIQRLEWPFREPPEPGRIWLNGVGLFQHWVAYYQVVGLGKAELTIWADDRMVISLPAKLSRASLLAAVRVCTKCGAKGEVCQLGFADRVCPACRLKLMDQVEFPGWSR